MCIPPNNENPKKYFLELKELGIKNNLKKLSMGMSSDFLDAINCGSTHIRLGEALFGERKNQVMGRTEYMQSVYMDQSLGNIGDLKKVKISCVGQNSLMV